GELTRLADAWKAPIVAVPNDLPQPRAAVGALAVPPLIALEDIGLFPGARQWVKEAIRSLGARRDEIIGGGDFIPQLARSIGRTITLIYGGGSIGAGAAQRWETPRNENAKAPACWNARPDLSHKQGSGWRPRAALT